MRCFIHCGAPKTGSSSIQQALFYGIRDPRYQYFSGGYFDNGSHAIEALFAEEPHCRRLYERHLASSRGAFPVYRDRLQGRLDRAVDSCRRRHMNLILSAEDLWRATPEAFGRLRRIRQYLVGHGFEIVVIGYLRPWLPWLASLYQQSLKFANPDFGLEMFRELLDFRQIIEQLWLIFGRGNVRYYLYDPAGFPGGCVVQHFCAQIGLPCPVDYRVNSNESLSLPACQLLFAYNRQRGRLPPTGLSLGAEYAPILRKLQCLSGPVLCLHPSVLRAWAPQLQQQAAWLEQELGLTLTAPSAGGRGDPSAQALAVGSVEEMAHISGEALHWLSERTGLHGIQQGSRAAVEHAAAQALRQLTGRLQHHRSLPSRAVQRLRVKLIHLRYGC